MLHCTHVASRMQCELIRIHIAWAFVESNNHCDLNQKALMVAFRLNRNKGQALVDPVHPDLCTLIAVYIDKATDTAHMRAGATLYTRRRVARRVTALVVPYIYFAKLKISAPQKTKFQVRRIQECALRCVAWTSAQVTPPAPPSPHRACALYRTDCARD